MRYKKILTVTIFAFALCAFLTGCSSTTVSENELLSYIEQDDPMGPRIPRRYDSTGEIRYYDLKVDKRLTDKDARSDQI